MYSVISFKKTSEYIKGHRKLCKRFIGNENQILLDQLIWKTFNSQTQNHSECFGGFLILVDLLINTALYFLSLLYSKFTMNKHYCCTILYICIETVCLITEHLRWQNILLFILQLLHRATLFAGANKHTLLMFFSKTLIPCLTGSWLCISVMWWSLILLRNKSLLQMCQIYSYDKVMNAGLLYRKSFLHGTQTLLD